MKLVDTHAHLDGEEFKDDLILVVERAVEKAVHHVLLPSINLASVDRVLELSREYKGYFYPMIGLHPEEVKADWREQLRLIREKDCSQFVAIGEVGLDFYWSREYQQQQLECFEEQVKWSIDSRLPLVIHCRKAQNEMVAILKKYRTDLPGGIFHCFAGNEKEAAELLAFDRFLIGVGGVLTFKKSHLPEVLPSIPLNRLVVETDAPYMAPVPMRGKRNESSFIPYIINKMAEAYGISPDEVARQTTQNAETLFNLA